MANQKDNMDHHLRMASRHPHPRPQVDLNSSILLSFCLYFVVLVVFISLCNSLYDFPQYAVLLNNHHLHVLTQISVFEFLHHGSTGFIHFCFEYGGIEGSKHSKIFQFSNTTKRNVCELYTFWLPY